MGELIYRGKASRVIGCTRDTVTNLAKRGELRVVERTPGGRRKYDIDEVREVGKRWRARYGTPSFWRES